MTATGDCGVEARSRETATYDLRSQWLHVGSLAVSAGTLQVTWLFKHFSNTRLLSTFAIKYSVFFSIVLFMLQLESLELEVKSLREAGASGGWFQAMPLPEGLAISSSEVIASLNEHLVVALQVCVVSIKYVTRFKCVRESIILKFTISRFARSIILSTASAVSTITH